MKGFTRAHEAYGLKPGPMLHMVPALTTVHVPMEEIGRTAVRMALHPDERQHVVLGTHVVIRDSAAPATPT
jgi:LacI family transcriptional regulator